MASWLPLEPIRVVSRSPRPASSATASMSVSTPLAGSSSRSVPMMGCVVGGRAINGGIVSMGQDIIDDRNALGRISGLDERQPLRLVDGDDPVGAEKALNLAAVINR